MRSLFLFVAGSCGLLIASCSSSSPKGSDPIAPSTYMGVGGAAGLGGGAGTSGTNGVAGTTSFGGSPLGGVGGSGGGAAGAKTNVVTHMVAPSDTDPAITDFLEPHAVLVPVPAPSQNLLFVHLGKTGSMPLDSTAYVTQAALAGYHVIDLRYPNAVSVSAECDGDPDPACHEKIRAELFDGTDKSKKVTVSPASAITNRLTKLVTYLDATYPTESWKSFLVAGALDWSRLSLSGHSLGGGEVAYIAKKKAVTRVILLAAPIDGSDAAPAPWVAAVGASPTTVFSGLVHVDDASYARITAGWGALGMYGADMPVNVDGPPGIFQTANALMSSAPPPNGADPHDAIVVDSATPTVNGAAVYTLAWARLIGPN